MEHPFYMASAGEDSNSIEVTLKPALAIYKATMSYDDSGNANITIRDKRDGKIILDMSLDDGTISDMHKEFFNASN